MGAASSTACSVAAAFGIGCSSSANELAFRTSVGAGAAWAEPAAPSAAMAPNSPAIFFSIDVLHISGRNAGIPQREPLPNVPDCGDWRLAAGAGTSSRPVQEVEQQPADLGGLLLLHPMAG